MDEYIRFYNYEYFQTKTGLTLLSLRQARVCFKTQHLCAKRQCSKLRT